MKQIDIESAAYRISSTREASHRLVQSIRTLGVLNAPVLIPEGQHFTIVAGFARIDASRKIGMREIRCRLMPADAGQEQCVRIAIVDNAMHRELNLVEQANAIGLLAQVHPHDPQIVQAARECGLAVNRDMVHKLLKVGQMPLTLQQAVLDGAIALPVALQLTAMDDDLQAEALTRLLIEIRVGLNRQRQILDWVVAIARRDTISIVELLNAGDLQRLRTASDMDRRQKAMKIRQVIRQMRYPAITRHEAQYARTVKSLKLKKGTHLLAPPHFEGQTYSLKFDFQTYDELLEKQKEFRQLIKSRAIRDLCRNSR